MADAADQVAADDERAMARLDEQLREQRIAASMALYDPTRPVYCEDCGERVSDERLKALPHTGRCVACAAAVELKNGWGKNR